jgi:hypothetical protein
MTTNMSHTLPGLSPTISLEAMLQSATGLSQVHAGVAAAGPPPVDSASAAAQPVAVLPTLQPHHLQQLDLQTRQLLSHSPHHQGMMLLQRQRLLAIAQQTRAREYQQQQQQQQQMAAMLAGQLF